MENQYTIVSASVEHVLCDKIKALQGVAESAELELEFLGGVAIYGDNYIQACIMRKPKGNSKSKSEKDFEKQPSDIDPEEQQKLDEIRKTLGIERAKFEKAMEIEPKIDFAEEKPSSSYTFSMENLHEFEKMETPIEPEEDKETCRHKRCKVCGGTGKRKDGAGICIKAFACKCSKCKEKVSGVELTV